MADLNQQTTVRLGKLPPGRMTLTVRVDARELHIRLWLALRLIKLGCRIAGIGITLEPPPEVPA